MYCRNCGKEIKDGSRFCLYCGQAVQGGNPGAQGTVQPPPAAKKKNEILRKWWFWAAVIIFAGAVIVFAINDISAEETVEKLQKFTYIDTTDEKQQIVRLPSQSRCKICNMILIRNTI